MAVITISRQMGSLGNNIANIVASKMGYRLVFRDLINKAAQLAGAPEMALADIDELGLLGFSPSPQLCQAYHEAVKQVVEELADQGDVVIVGRAGQVILANHANSIHVRLIAPIERRIERITQKQNITPECALAQIKASDQHRARYIRRCFGLRWDNPELYHIVINTGRMTADQAAWLICQFATERSANSRTTNLPSERNDFEPNKNPS
jgi:cytidylate kinase